MQTVGDIIGDQLARRQRRNPSYSLRSFSRDLGLNPGTLSAVMAGKRPLPKGRVEDVCRRLALTPRLKARFVRAWRDSRDALTVPAEADERRVELNETHFQIIAEWEHYAVLTLMRTAGFRSEPAWMARRLGLTEQRLGAVLRRLEAAGFIARDEAGQWRRSAPALKTSEDVASAALRAAHEEELGLAAKALARFDVGLRDISSMTLAVHPDRLAEAKALIRSFRDQMAGLLEDEASTEVYQLCIQLFPLSNVQNTNAQTGGGSKS